MKQHVMLTRKVHHPICISEVEGLRIRAQMGPFQFIPCCEHIKVFTDELGYGRLL
jgi:hypothetical protein